MTQHVSIPRDVFKPTGRALPYVPEPARQHPENTGSLTVAQSTLVPDDGLGALVTAPVETELRDIDAGRSDRENAELPFLGAQVVVSEYRSQAYGRHTRVWLNYGRTVGELSPTEAREALEAMRAFLPQLEAVVAFAEQEAASDFEGDPEIAAADREAEDRRIRAITERCA
ncbi:hypothetical protein [Streptomyces sp. NPDC002078]